MKNQRFAIATSCIAILAATSPAIAQTTVQDNSSRVAIDSEETLVNMSNYSIRINSNGIFMESGDRQISVSSDNSISINNWLIPNLSNQSSNTTTSVQTHRFTPLTQTIQQTSLALELVELEQPHTLNISIPATASRLTGQIKLNGRVIQTVRDKNTQINLSPFLARGRHTIEISGTYSPATSSVTVEFLGVNTQVTQETGGNGKLNHLLIIDVR